MAVVFGLGAFYLTVETPYWLAAGWMILFFILVIVDLLRTINRADRELTNLLVSIRQGDFSNTYPENIRETRRLYNAFNTITKEFRKVRSERESGFHFLQAVVEHCGVPMLSYHVMSERITMVNKEAKVLFGIPHLTRLESLARVNPLFLTSIRELHSDEKILIRLPMRGEYLHLSIIAKEIVLQGERHKLIAVHNINSELDQKEIESWQKLIRVLSHEIKNSVIPISTLAEVTSAMLAEIQEKGKSISTLSKEESEDLVLSINTIEKRSKGLVKFVSSYSDLARVPKLELAEYSLNVVIGEVVKLQEKALTQRGIRLEMDISGEELHHTFDKDLIVQALINVTKNAIEAMEAGGTLKIELHRKSNRVSIIVSDTGTGMDPETLENIFIPFYTTKKEGSGIGLSLSRQILRAHGGSLRATSKIGAGSSFELIF